MVVDETSMVDVLLMNALLKAIAGQSGLASSSTPSISCHRYGPGPGPGLRDREAEPSRCSA